MDNVEDIFDTLESNNVAFEDFDNKPKFNNNNSNNNFSNNQNFKNKFKKESLWDKTDFKPTLIDPIKLQSKANSYMFYDYIANDNKTGIDETTVKMIESVCRSLKSRDYKFRHNNSADDKVANTILKIEGIVTESYLPWGKYNTNIQQPKRGIPSKEAYSIAMAYHKKFKELPPAIRAILACHVNALLGDDCTDPVNFMLCWTECGSTDPKAKFDFKKVGNLPFLLKICEDANIPVFNFKNKDTLTNLKGLLV